MADTGRLCIFIAAQVSETTTMAGCWHYNKQLTTDNLTNRFLSSQSYNIIFLSLPIDVKSTLFSKHLKNFPFECWHQTFILDLVGRLLLTTVSFHSQERAWKLRVAPLGSKHSTVWWLWAWLFWDKLFGKINDHRLCEWMTLLLKIPDISTFLPDKL